MLRKTGLFLLLALTLSAKPPQVGPSAYDTLKQRAEAEYAEKSFSRAHELYEQASKLTLPAAEKRWVEFRLADTAWRADAASPSADPAVREGARKSLEELVRRDDANRDRIWAEANESLGDYFLTHPYEHNAGQAQRYYVNALDFWAGSDDIALARRRYLAIVWRMADERTGYPVPREILVNALSIADTPADRTRARFLLAQQLLREGRPESIERALEHFEAIIAEGKKTEWYDDALFHLAQHLSAGRSVVVDGRVERRTDLPRALELYRRLVNEFAKGESRYRDDAERAIRNITEVSVGVSVHGTYLPDSEQEVMLTWRNTKQVELTLTAVDLTADIQPKADRNWIDDIRTEGKPVLRRWTFETNDKGVYEPGMDRIRLTPKLERGAYVITARAGGKTARQLVLVTDAHITVHASPKRVHVFVSDVLTGEPIAGARVWSSQTRERKTIQRTAQTDANGLAEFASEPGYGMFLITAASGARQAFHQTHTYFGFSGQADAWHIYAFTDRPAYRPEETVQWKIIARARRNEEWTTPAGQQFTYEITSPRGEKVTSGIAKLSDFGSFWAELPLTASMPLGEYTIVFKMGENQIGYAQLFRLEEYKLPEYAVTVSTPEGKVFRLGDTIEATIEANYYFGGPVANASVEAVVYQQPYYRLWYPWREYPWYYTDQPTHYRGEQVMRRETLKTDANGRATLRIDTQRDGNEMLYRIEARVVDASRREVRGQGSVRVLRQRYAVIAHPEHYLHRPGDQVEVDFKAMDANDKPVQTTGTVTVIRREWRHVGRASARQAGYHEEEILSTKVTTNASGEATFRFTPKREGYYAIRWSSEDIDPNAPTRVRDLVTAETAVWVADRTSRDLGYFTGGGVEIIVDKETMRAGETAMVMIVTPSSGRWVLFSTSGGEMLDTQVFRVDGTVKLVQLPLDDRHVPNFFVTASSIFDRTFATDSERIVVPPVEHFLNVEVKSDREQYEPRQEGTLTVTTRDVDGKPVPAEVAIAVSDEAVTAIQQDLAGDPRQFFFGEQRHQTLQVSAGVHAQQYVRLVQRDKQLLDDRYIEDEESAGRRRDGSFADGAEGGVRGGVVGGVVGGVAQESAADALMSRVSPPPPAAPPRPEAVTVTAQAPVVQTKQAGVGAGNVAVEVRSDFRSTAFWKPDVVTDASGTATVKFRYPEALTTWRATARAASRGSQFGIGSSTAKTNMPLIVRLQAPRFFVVGDRTVVSAVINNNTGAAQRVEPKLEVEGLTLASDTNAPVNVPAHGEARVDWTVLSEKPGTAKLRVTGRSDTHGDAMEKTFIVYEHGIDKLVARSGKLRASEAIIKLDLPRERRSTDLVVQVAPSLAVTMLDALPYLIDFPYGCTEQTMSRFLPAAIVAQTLEKLGAKPRIDDKKLAAVTAASMARLYDFQHQDGGWGWWKEGDSDPFMTAYVIWGFSIARDAGLKVNTGAVDRAAEWLDTQLSERERDWNLQAWMLQALSAWRNQPSLNAQKAFDNVWKNRERLTAYSRALLALAAHRYGNAERAAILVRNLENGAKIDRTPDQSVLIRGGSSTAETMATAHWGQDGFWWRWYEGPVETTAFVLQALVTIDPKHKLVEPAMNWLVKNRRGAQWSNTRDTAIAIFALNDYLLASGETLGDVAYEISVNGKVIASKTLTAADALSAPSRFPVDPALLADAQQEIRIRRTGGRADAALYFSAEARFVSLEEPVTAAGNELFVRREYFRLAPRPTLLKGVLYDRVPLRDRDAIKSGERVEVVVTVETKNDYEYLIFEDLKPAGFEAVELQSGQMLFATDKANRSAWVYQELRDRKVAMFIDHLAQGVWEIRYTLRAETPGSFHALPLLGQAMYVPDIRANGDEVRVEVRE